MEYYSAIKKNTFESVLMKWIKLEPIIQGYCYHLSKFHIYAFVYCIGVFLSGLLGSMQDTGCLGLVHGDDPER